MIEGISAVTLATHNMPRAEPSLCSDGLCFPGNGILPAETAAHNRLPGLFGVTRDQWPSQKAHQTWAISTTTRNHQFGRECVVGSTGLEPATRPL